MVKWIETTGRSEEDAISAALFQLGLERDDVSIEVIERAKSGFLGFGGNPAKVRVSYEVDQEGGSPKPMKDPFQELRDVARPSAPKQEKKAEVKKPQAPKPQPVQPKAEPKPEVKAEPVQPTAPPTPLVQAAPELTAAADPPAQPMEEETILTAKTAWKPASKSARPQRREQRRPRPVQNQLQEGDEVLIGGEKPVHVHKEVTLTPAATDDEKAQKISAFLTGLLERLEVEATPEIFATDEGGYQIILQGQNLGAIIGRRGETLDAIQQLTNYAVNHGQSKRVRIHIDAEGYRAKREESLQRLAVKVAGKVVKYRKNMTLEAMNAYERHVIHTALQDYPNVTTYSTGVEPNRRTVVAYAPGQE